MPRRDVKPGEIAAWAQWQATAALLKFCEEHNKPPQYLEHVRRCLEALEQDDIEAAVRAYESVPLGGMGTFTDWIPDGVYAHEDSVYADAVFSALTGRWSRLMKLLAVKLDE